ncbi:MAG: DUF2461 family protein [Candidatus Acidiferrales bacterium]
MAEKNAVFSPELFRFFRQLGQNNQKPWMDENRDSYRSLVVEPFRELLGRLTPAAQKLNPQFVASGRVGENFSRINRDIRFAKDKSPYRTQMYLYFAGPENEGGQIYAGISAETVTAGFRIYSDSRTSPLVQIARPRAQANAKWLERQQKRLGKRYESYWYSTEKGEWTKRRGWPIKPDDWKKLQAWVVRRKLSPTAATRRGFENEVAKTFRDVYPLYKFTSSPKWKP